MDHRDYLFIPNPPSQIPQPLTATLWTRTEDIIFERALADIPHSSPNIWQLIASQIPGNIKTPQEIFDHYQDPVTDIRNIEAGLIELPAYNDNSEGDDAQMVEESKNTRPPVKKKANKWTYEEHKRFLRGLEIYGKGDWKNISINAVQTRTASQVTSHAQKFFERQKKRDKGSNRRSIHDIISAHDPPNYSIASIGMPHDSSRSNSYSSGSLCRFCYLIPKSVGSLGFMPNL